MPGAAGSRTCEFFYSGRNFDPANADTSVMDDYEECFALLWDCLLMASLARAAGDHRMEMVWYAVGVEWWSAERPRWPWVASRAC